jgi:Kef-type K+ transport system membrane component KefB
VEISLLNLLLVVIVSFGVPYVLGFFPRLRIPPAVVEVLVGLVLGPSVLGWIEIDAAVEVAAFLGVTFLLFLAGLDLDLEILKHPVARLGAIGFLISLGLATLIELAFSARSLVQTPFLVAVALSATTVGIVAPALKDAGYLDTAAGRCVLAGGAAAEFGTIVVLGVYFARPESSPIVEVVLLIVLGILALVLLRALSWWQQREASTGVFIGLRHTSAQLLVRFAVALMLAGSVVAAWFGFEAILGTFLAGVVVGVLSARWDDREVFMQKIEAMGFGFFIPAFFVFAGLQLDFGAVGLTPFEIGRIVVLLLVLLMVRGVPALLYRRVLGRREMVAVGLMQATNFQFIVVAVEVGRSMDLITEGGGEALIAAGLLSAVLFPPLAIILLDRGRDAMGSSRA